MDLPVERPESPELEDDIRLKKTDESRGSAPVVGAAVGERADPGMRL